MYRFRRIEHENYQAGMLDFHISFEPDIVCFLLLTVQITVRPE